MNVAVVTIAAAILASGDKWLVLDEDEARRYAENAARLHAQVILLKNQIDNGELEIQETEVCPKCGATNHRDCAASGCPTV